MGGTKARKATDPMDNFSLGFDADGEHSRLKISMDIYSLCSVPVYDATECDDFDVNRDLPMLASKLPRWKTEIPYGSCVVVGYTMSAFFSGSREWTLGTNIQWAVIVGMPRSELPGDR